jgi:hypothetical protein
MRRTTIEFMIGWLDALRRDDVAVPRAGARPGLALPLTARVPST